MNSPEVLLVFLVSSSTECLSTSGNMPPCTTHWKTKTHTQSRSHPTWYSHTHRPDPNASVARPKHIYLKSADRTKWESSRQVCTLRSPAKTKFKTHYWEREKYKTLYFPFFFFFVFFFFFLKHNSFKKIFLPFQILHPPIRATFSKPP